MRESQLFCDNLIAKSQAEQLVSRVNLKKNVEGNLDVKSEVGIILPTYCEAANVKELIFKIENVDPDFSVLVIDDSSPDGTAQIVRNLQKNHSNILLFQRSCKKGLGTAITDGFKIFLSLGHTPKNIVTMDADFSHDPKDIRRLVKKADEGYDLVIGGRYCAGGRTERWSPFRVIISRIANIIASVVIGARIPDCTSGLRCYSSRLLRGIVSYLHSETYEIQIETVRQSIKRGFRVTFLPITFTNRKLGKSKLTFNEVQQFLFYVLKAKVEDVFKDTRHA